MEVSRREGHSNGTAREDTGPTLSFRFIEAKKGASDLLPRVATGTKAGLYR
jgi:hypothetical protein